MSEINVVNFPDRINQQTEETEYAQSMAADLAWAYHDLGLDAGFLPIFGQHIADLHLQSVYPGHASTIGLKQVLVEASGEKSWVRSAEIGEKHLERYAQTLQGTFSELHIKPILNGSDVDMTFKKLALHWIMFEMSADVLGHSCYMQERFVRYIPDFNGQSPFIHSDITVSRNFISGYVDDNNPLLDKMAEVDHADFRAGVALVLLEDALLRSGTLDSAVKARWVVRTLAQKYPAVFAGNVVTPHSRDEITRRLVNMKPAYNNGQWYNALFDSIDFHLDDDEEESTV